jgi:hypothetical protein
MFPSVVRGTGWPISTDCTNSHVGGVTCMTPHAFADDTTCGCQPDSTQASARMKRGLIPYTPAQ